MTPGYYGKLPSRGDFIGAGLSAPVVNAWDLWIGARLLDSRAAFEAEWTGVWLVAPVWHCALPGGQCGPRPLSGLMLPSIDKVGRYFPLLLAVEGGTLDPATRTLLEQVARDALEQDWSPDRLTDALAIIPEPVGALAPDRAEWWTDGGPYVPPTRFETGGLPDAALFQSMLRA